MSDLTTAVSGTSLDPKKWTLLNHTGEWADVTFIPWQCKWGPEPYNCGEDVKTVDCITVSMNVVNASFVRGISLSPQGY